MLYGLISTLQHYIGDEFLLWVDESDFLKLSEEYPHRNEWEYSSHSFQQLNAATDKINNRGSNLLKHRISAIKHVLKYLM